MEEEELNNLIYLLRIHHIDSEPLENLIKEYKELKKENRNIKNYIYYKEVVELNYIPKSKIREKIEELKSTSYYFEGEATTVAEVDILQDLLEEEN